jgi:hypothetical protein
MSATKIAASFRVSLTALVPKAAGVAGRGALWAWLHCHAALRTRGQPECNPAFRLQTLRPRWVERSAINRSMRHNHGREVSRPMTPRPLWRASPVPAGFARHRRARSAIS